MKKVAAAIAGLFTKPQAGASEVPNTITVDPSTHDIVIEAENFAHDGSTLMGPLTWRSSDTSVARLTVASDTMSAKAHCVGPGRSIVTLTDGRVLQSHVIQVERPQVVEQSSIKVRIKRVPKE